MLTKETIQKVINFVITVLTAVLSSFCVQSCK
ncbi:smalltalk protein [Prevotella copri]|uniref:Smalltalk protein n=1 Tax=Segatella copri TaxID=165179 RepID=A0AAW5IWM2_9BACT|nr:smalltalk protein [Segatella copri]MCP9553363.1 smalltalk protein [Segatella copri]MCP9574276.1 smalltalk protein [Segatella copri]MCP9577127.1 smalltalk protein [Segatella copri]MCP9580124.1 smalltalk protein [Segatella copri]MCP9582967.1 smalltalk protein [Segatella copri]